MTIYGWDCSDFDWSRGPVDLQAAYDDGIRLFTHKGTEGTKIRHKRTGEALSRARAAGVPYLGSYVVPRTPGNGGHGPVAAQVDYFLNYLDDQVPWWHQHPGWFWQVDLEHWGYDNVAPQIGVAVCDLLARTGRPVLLYASRGQYGDTIPGAYPLWQASYGDNEQLPYRHAYAVAGGDDSRRWARYSGRIPLVLQFGSRCRIGSQDGCDANAIRDETRWKALFEGDDPMATINQADFDALIWRVEAIASARDTVAGGPTKGQPVPLVGEVRQLAADVAAVKAAGQPTVDTAAIVDQVVQQLSDRIPTAEQVALAFFRQVTEAAARPPADTGTPQQS